MVGENAVHHVETTHYLRVTSKLKLNAAYLTILIVGHVLAPLLLLTYTNFNPNPLVVASLFSIGCISLSLYLLPKLKGTIIGIQWAKEMHGFNLIKSNVSKERI